MTLGQSVFNVVPVSIIVQRKYYLMDLGNCEEIFCVVWKYYFFKHALKGVNRENGKYKEDGFCFVRTAQP